MKKENVIPRKKLDNETEEQYKIYLREFYFNTNKPQPETRYQFACDNNLIDSEDVMDGKNGAYIKYLEEFYNDYYKELDNKVSYMTSKPRKIKIEPPKLSTLKKRITKKKETENAIDNPKRKFNWKSLIKNDEVKQENVNNGMFALKKSCSGLFQLIAAFGLLKIIINAVFGSPLLFPIIQLIGGLVGATACEVSLAKEKKIRKQAKKAARKEKKLQRNLKLKEGLSKLLSKKKSSSETEVQEIIAPEEPYEEDDTYFDVMPDAEEYEFDVEPDEEYEFDVEPEQEKVSLIEKISNIFKKKEKNSETEELITPEDSYEEDIYFDVMPDDEEYEFDVEPDELSEENTFIPLEDAYAQIGPNGEYTFHTNFDQEKETLGKKASNAFNNIFKKKDTTKEEVKYNLDFEPNDFTFDTTPDDEEVLGNNYHFQKNQPTNSKVIFDQPEISGTSVNIGEFTEPKRTFKPQTKVKKLI